MRRRRSQCAIKVSSEDKDSIGDGIVRLPVRKLGIRVQLARSPQCGCKFDSTDQDHSGNVGGRWNRRTKRVLQSLALNAVVRRVSDGASEVIEPAILNSMHVQIGFGLFELLSPINVGIGQELVCVRWSSPEFVRVRQVIRKSMGGRRNMKNQQNRDCIEPSFMRACECKSSICGEN